MTCLLVLIIVFPQLDVKTALEAGIVMNLDNELEAEMVETLLKNECSR